jgi:phosphinothricin acetyltransferase
MEIRLATEDDAAAVQAIYAPIVASTAISFELEPPTVAEMAARIAAVFPSHPWLALVDAGRVLGYAYAHPLAPRAAYRWSVETSVYVAGAARRSGVGRALYGSLLKVLRCQGYRQALAGIALPNPASVALHESVGFRCIGVQQAVGWKLGAWHDVGWWQRGLTASTEPPAPPVGVDRLPADVLAGALARGRPGLGEE